MIAKGWLGQKSGSGFYRKIKDKDGNSKIEVLDLERMEYGPKDNPKFLILEALKSKDNTEDRMRSFQQGDTESVNLFRKGYLKLFGEDDDKAIEFFREFYYRLFAYCSNRVPEICDDLQAIDETVKAGFNWECGPFEIWDMLGPRETVEQMEKAGYPPAGWVYKMLEEGHRSFYRGKEDVIEYFDSPSNSYSVVPRTRDRILVDVYRRSKTIWKNEGCDILDLGDGVFNAAFSTKRNTIDMEVLAGINKAVEIAEAEEGCVLLGNSGDDFSFGANLAMIGISAYKGNLDIVEAAALQFQQTAMRLRYSPVPVVAAPFGRTLGGSVELCMHCDSVQAAAETYMGLVEVGVGLIPAGSGTKEFALRASDSYIDGDPKTPRLLQGLVTLAKGKVSTSAYDAFDLGYLRPGIDHVTINRERLLTDAKRRVLDLADGYTPPKPREDVTVLGRSALGYFYTAIRNMRIGEYISAYDEEIARKIAYVICGGDLSCESQVSEQYLLEIERVALMELVANKKTMQRIEHLLKKGKPLRN